MTDIEHAKKYAEESISLAISMYNPKAEIIAETACLYGLTFKNEQIAELERKLEQTEKDLADYQFNYPTIKELEKENAELKEKLKPENCLKLLAKEGYIKFTSDQLTKAKEIIKEFMEYKINEYDGSLEIHFEELKKQAERFLKG